MNINEIAKAAAVGDRVMILGGLPKIRGCIGTVSCRKRDEGYVNVYVKGMGKYILPASDLLKQNDVKEVTDI